MQGSLRSFYTMELRECDERGVVFKVFLRNKSEGCVMNEGYHKTMWMFYTKFKGV